MATVLSPFGGVALDSTLGDKLVRAVSDDLRRSLDGTWAFWVCPADGTNGGLSHMRGVNSGSYFLDYSCSAPNLAIGLGGEVSITDHVDGDWYLAVVRNDTLTWSYTIDVFRARDSGRFAASVFDTSGYAALSGEMDYAWEGLWALLALGSSGHWGFQGYGYFDLFGIWDRALGEEEVLEVIQQRVSDGSRQRVES